MNTLEHCFGDGEMTDGNISQGYDGSIHGMTSEKAAVVRKRGHTKELEFARRIGGKKERGRKKTDVVGPDGTNYSHKGAKDNLQIFMCNLNTSKTIHYGPDHLVYKWQDAGNDHRYYKLVNDDREDGRLLAKWTEAADNLIPWLEEKKNFQNIVEMAFSNYGEVDKLVVLREVNQDAYVYEMEDVMNLWWRDTPYTVNRTDRNKITINGGNVRSKEMFYFEVRGGKDHCGSLTHGVRPTFFYPFLEKNLDYEIVPA